VVVGDVVLIAAGDEVPADSRIIAASALKVDGHGDDKERRCSTPG
jgi:magnesium-transporting ATPase (P-type)